MMSLPINDTRVLAGMKKMLAMRSGAIDAGAKPIGWKVGFGSAPALEKFSLDAPLIGYLIDSVVVENGAHRSVDGWACPVIEPEIAVYIAADLPDGIADEQGAQAAIAAIGPAIEIANMDQPPEDVEIILSGNIFNRGLILGEASKERAGANVDGLQCSVSQDGKSVCDTGDIEGNTGRILDIITYTANLLPQFGEHLRAGDVVIVGSIMAPAVFAHAGETIDYTLKPFDTLSVTLTS